MATKTPKPPIGVPIRPNSASLSEGRQSLQKIPRGGMSGGGVQGPPGVSVGDPRSLQVIQFQISVKANDFFCDIPLFSVPHGWAFAVDSLDVYCYAGYGGCGHAGAASSYYVIRVATDDLPPSPVVAWGANDVTPCPVPDQPHFYWFDHPSAPGPVAVSSSDLTIGPTTYKFWPRVPFLANPQLSQAITVNLYAKYGCSGGTFPGASFIGNVRYWLTETRLDEQSSAGELNPWEVFNPPHTNVFGSCPDFPVA